MENMVMPEMKVTAKRPATASASNADVVGVEVSKMGVLGEKGMSATDRKALERMLKTLEGLESDE